MVVIAKDETYCIYKFYFCNILNWNCISFIQFFLHNENFDNFCYQNTQSHHVDVVLEYRYGIANDGANYGKYIDV